MNQDIIVDITFIEEEDFVVFGDVQLVYRVERISIESSDLMTIISSINGSEFIDFEELAS